MTKEAEEACAFAAKRLAEAKKKKAEAEEVIKEAESDLKAVFKSEGLLTYTFPNGYTIELRKTAETRVVDTAKLKAAGLFDEYSKVRAAFEQIGISNPNDEFLVDLNERRAKHIEEGKKNA